MPVFTGIGGIFGGGGLGSSAPAVEAVVPDADVIEELVTDSEDDSAVGASVVLGYELGLLYDSPFGAMAPGNRKITSYTDLNLLAGSSETFRNSVGGFFINAKDSDNHYSVPPQFYKFLPYKNPNPNIHTIKSFYNDKVNDILEDAITYGYSITDAEQAQRNVKTILPHSTFVVQMESNPDNQNLSDPVIGSKYWKTLFTGENFNNTQTQKIYDNGVYDDHHFSFTFPYPKIMEQTFANADDKQYIEIGYRYNNYFRQYQAAIDNIESELLIPNYYVMHYVAAAQREASDGEEITSPPIESGTDYYNQISFNNNLDSTEIKALIIDNVGAEDVYDSGTGMLLNKAENSIEKYLNELYPVSSSLISPLVNEAILRKSKNILIPSTISAHAGAPGSLDYFTRHYPYYNYINFTPNTAPGMGISDSETVDLNSYIATNSPISVAINSNNYTGLFLRSLKEIFNNESPEELTTDNISFLQNEKFLVPTMSPDADEKYTTTGTTTLRSVDFVELILYSHNKIKNENDNFTILGSKMPDNSLMSDALYDDKGVYRAYNSKNALRVLNKTLGVCSSYKLNTIYELLNSSPKPGHANPMDGEFDFNDLISDYFQDTRPIGKNMETLAYRIEKIGGTASGDSNTQNTLQNFWIFNSPYSDIVDYVDTQIKYNTDYTYRVYAYVLTGGVKYKFSNLQISRIIGAIREIPEDLESPIVAYCIEFYNPDTEEITTDYLSRDVYESVLEEISGTTIEVDSSFLNSESRRLAVANTTSKTVAPPFYANFLATTQPSFKIFEIPVYSKTYRVLDNPPNQLNVIPNYTINNSNTLLFDMYHETFNNEPYPRIITNNDATIRGRYLHGKDLVANSELQNHTVSPADTIEVFRLDYKPESFTEFEGNEYASISLKMDNSYYPYNTARMTDVVKSNTKYYYLFRAVNELGMHGNTDVVIEAELVNDGGYKYALFDTLYEHDLLVNDFEEKYEKFKNVFELIPNLSQTIINTEGVDYTQTAKSQYNKVTFGDSFNIENIWGETFKIRLTSKKTGKKIDLNVTYHIDDQLRSSS